MPTIEIVTAGLIPGAEIGDPNNQAAQTLKEMGATLVKADGVGPIHFGMEIENPNQIQMFITWDSIEAHQAFMGAEAYGGFIGQFISISDGSMPQLTHADLQPAGAITKALSAPVTEVATFYFDGSPTSTYVDGALKFAAAIEEAQIEGFHGAVVGVTHEELEKEGVNGKAAVLAVGWSSVEAHMKFRETATFKDNIALLREGAGKVEMHHTTFMNFVPE